MFSTLFKSADKTAINAVVEIDDIYKHIHSFLPPQALAKQRCVSRHSLATFNSIPINLSHIIFDILEFDIEKRIHFIRLLQKNKYIQAILQKPVKNAFENVLSVLLKDKKLLTRKDFNAKDLVETALLLHPQNAALFLYEIDRNCIYFYPDEPNDWKVIFCILNTNNINLLIMPFHIQGSKLNRMLSAIDKVSPLISEALRPQFKACCLTSYFALTQNWSELRLQLNGGYKNLRSAELDHAELPDSKLSLANLASASLLNANLERAYLDGANLTHARLDSANLSYTNFEGAILKGASLSYAKVTGTNFANANLIGVKLTMVDLDTTNLTRTILIGVTLSAKQIAVAKAKGAILTLSDLVNTIYDLGSTADDALAKESCLQLLEFEMLAVYNRLKHFPVIPKIDTHDMQQILQNILLKKSETILKISLGLSNWFDTVFSNITDKLNCLLLGIMQNLKEKLEKFGVRQDQPIAWQHTYVFEHITFAELINIIEFNLTSNISTTDVNEIQKSLNLLKEIISMLDQINALDKKYSNESTPKP